MASRLLDAISKERVKHTVGNLNSFKVDTVSHGLVAKEVLENYSVVEDSFNAEGEREMGYLTNNANECFLLAGSEEMYVIGGLKDGFADYYIAKGEKARPVYFRKGLRFECSNFELKTVSEAKKGHYATWDIAKKKYIIQQDKPTAGIVLRVVEVERASVLDGVKCVRFEFIEKLVAQA